MGKAHAHMEILPPIMGKKYCEKAKRSPIAQACKNYMKIAFRKGIRKAGTPFRKDFLYMFRFPMNFIEFLNFGEFLLEFETSISRAGDVET